MLKKSLFFVLVTVLASLIVFILADSLLQYGLTKTREDVIGKMNYLVHDTTYYDMVCFGSSRVLAHIDPRIIERQTRLKTYNCGFNGASVFDYKIFLNLYLENRRPPKYILIHVDSATFERKVTAELPKFFPFINNKYIYSGLARHEKSVYYVHRFPPLRIMYYEDLIKWIGIKSLLGLKARDVYQDYNGFVNIHVNGVFWNGFYESLYKEWYDMVRQPYEPDPSLKAGISMLHSIMDICKRKNIRVIFSSSPIVGGDVFVKYHKITEIVEKETRSYNPHYYWAHGDVLDRKVYYFNYTHMTYAGAEYYTSNLSEKINSWIK